MSITVSNISKRYGEQLALDQVTFSIKPGEIVGLLGPNGAGKSTMMKIITCFIPPSSGEASVYGFDIREQSLEVRKKVGYLPENNPLYTDMYIKEYLEFVAGIHQLGKNTAKRVKQMMEVTGLMPEKGKKIGALSKGFRQRVGLAQAMIHNPDVLILDEPTSGLDPNQLVDIRNLIAEIGKQKTVMLSTHIMQEVEAMCSRAIIINHGKIVADNSTGQLLKNADSTEHVLVEFDKDVKAEVLKSIKGVMSVKHITGYTWLVESAKDLDVRQEIFRFAVDNGLAVLSMQKQSSRLEDVFQQLTKK
ncbi:MAG: gliding motility-associated ABC transporter ATP-binding subunit GldA [Lentimicrobiaceae bacterium]|nr:gliding motility-associated ABC transporter ATP-binding subunit GldA [Lentimicrobiaceae bacterium]HPG34580.1 gliding motility-associated ABC transporter ATP-binding subunit GldA [Lentimicrobium sp.]